MLGIRGEGIASDKEYVGVSIFDIVFLMIRRPPGSSLFPYTTASDPVPFSTNQQNYQHVYTSPQLPDETVADQHLFDIPVMGRYIRLHIEEGDWPGDYAEIQIGRAQFGTPVPGESRRPFSA